jgi:iron complex outermembrane receptor protein
MSGSTPIRAATSTAASARSSPRLRPGFIPFPSESADGVPFHGQFTQEVRVAGDSGPLSYTGGRLLLQRVDQDRQLRLQHARGPGRRTAYAYQNQKTESWALFANLAYKVSGQARSRRRHPLLGRLQEVPGPAVQSPFGAPPTPIERASPDSTNVSFNLNGTYAATDDVNLYARVASGYRAPSIQGRLLFGDTISVASKETIMSYEAGVKGKAAEGRIRFDADVFYYRLKDMQLTAWAAGPTSTAC